MVTSLRRRMDNESGFTLIELLVVMIIISILMAVAVPVFLGQKQKAVASQAKQNIKHVADTIESCAAGTTTGEISAAAPVGGTALNCASETQVSQDEPSLGAIIGSGAGKVAVSSSGADAYKLTGITANAAAQQVTFTYDRSATLVKKTCAGPAVARMCPQGVW